MIAGRRSGTPLSACDHELAFLLQQTQGIVIGAWRQLLRDDLRDDERKALAKVLVEVAERLLVPVPVVVEVGNDQAE